MTDFQTIALDIYCYFDFEHLQAHRDLFLHQAPSLKRQMYFAHTANSLIWSLGFNF